MPFCLWLVREDKMKSSNGWMVVALLGVSVGLGGCEFLWSGHSSSTAANAQSTQNAPTESSAVAPQATATAPPPAPVSCQASIDAVRASLKGIKAVSKPDLGSMLSTPENPAFGNTWKVSQRDKKVTLVGMHEGAATTFEGTWDSKRLIAISEDGKYALDWTIEGKVMAGTVFSPKIAGAIYRNDGSACDPVKF
jgi:hypothetical protein